MTDTTTPEAGSADPQAEPAESAPNAADFAGSSLPADELERLTTDIVVALKTVFDPEIPSDIYELGLIYKVEIDDDRHVNVDMTLTAPGCPVAGEMPQWVADAVAAVECVGEVEVTLVWDPPWSPERMSDDAKMILDIG